jgi:hypothetical protein
VSEAASSTSFVAGYWANSWSSFSFSSSVSSSDQIVVHARVFSKRYKCHNVS